MRIDKLVIALLLNTLWVISLRWDRVCAGISQNVYVRPSDVCHAHLESNALKTMRVRSKIDCAAECQREEACQSILYCKDAEIRQCLLSTVQTDASCPNNNSSCTNLEKATAASKLCRHGGIIRPDDTCQCVSGYVGPRCDQLTTDCDTLKRQGMYTFPGTFLVKPPSSLQPFYIFCTMLGGQFALLHQATTPSFNRSWSEYVEGFKDVLPGGKVNYWLGLRYWHALTTDMTFNMGVYILGKTGTVRKMYFWNVTVQNETMKFRMNITSMHKFKASLCSGCSFSTFDQDNDNDLGVNCAETHGGGWWYSDCGGSNPTGPLLRAGGNVPTGHPPEAFWNNFDQKRKYPSAIKITLWKQ